MESGISENNPRSKGNSTNSLPHEGDNRGK